VEEDQAEDGTHNGQKDELQIRATKGSNDSMLFYTRCSAVTGGGSVRDDGELRLLFRQTILYLFYGQTQGMAIGYTVNWHT